MSSIQEQVISTSYEYSAFNFSISLYKVYLVKKNYFPTKKKILSMQAYVEQSEFVSDFDSMEYSNTLRKQTLQ